MGSSHLIDPGNNLDIQIQKKFWTTISFLYKHIEAETNGRHFPDSIFKCIFLNENVLISLKILLKFIPKGLINNIPALV